MLSELKKLPTNTRQGATPLLGNFPFCLEVVEDKQSPIRSDRVPFLSWQLGLLPLLRVSPALNLAEGQFAGLEHRRT